jgi:hypothetical protein
MVAGMNPPPVSSFFNIKPDPFMLVAIEFAMIHLIEKFMFGGQLMESRGNFCWRLPWHVPVQNLKPLLLESVGETG